MQKTLIIDHYDSFTYNLYQYFSELGGKTVVRLHDQLTKGDIERISPTHIVLSAGPGTVEKHEDFAISGDVIHAYAGKIPILGVCLGHQGIVHAYGGMIEKAPLIMHGKQSDVTHNEEGLFKGIKSPMKAMRYHSLRASRDQFPAELKVTAWVEGEDTIMAVEHSKYPVFGIQFHPESVGTPDGKQLLSHFLAL